MRSVIYLGGEGMEYKIKEFKKVIAAQTEANKKWQEKNKERAKYLSDRSRARSFLKNIVTEEELAEFEEILRNRREELNK